jgi:hypothetical protein
VVDADENVLNALYINVYDSWFVPIADGSGVLCRDNTGGLLVSASFYGTRFIVDEFSAVGGTIGGDTFGALDASFYDCQRFLHGRRRPGDDPCRAVPLL